MSLNSNNTDLNKIHVAVDAEYDFMSTEGAFGGWISCLWGEYDSLDTIDEYKEAFFILLERILRDGKAILSTPPVRDDVEPGYWVICDGYSSREPKRRMERTDESEPNRMWVWDVPIEQQIEYIRSVFPKEINGIHDSELNDFWYLGECPGIAWIHPETGVLYAS